MAVWGHSNNRHLEAAQSSDGFRTDSQSPKEPRCHGQFCTLPRHRGLPHNKGILSNETVRIDKEERVSGSGSCALCKHDCCWRKCSTLDMEQQVWFLNLGSAHVQRLRSLTRGRALSLCHWSVVFVLYFSAQWLRKPLCCARWFSRSKRFCTGTSCFSWVQILHTYDLPQT